MATFNETTGAAYAGKNIDRLECAEIAAGYDTARGWAGFKQWLTAGRVVRRGEHGTACVTVMGNRGEDSDAPGDVGDGSSSRRRGGVRGFRVFHYDQTVRLHADGGTCCECGGDHECEDCPTTFVATESAPAPRMVAVDMFGRELGPIT